jgi:hypothetical protein
LHVVQTLWPAALRGVPTVDRLCKSTHWKVDMPCVHHDVSGKKEAKNKKKKRA